MEGYSFLTWIFGVGVGFLSLIGVNKIVENSLKRRWDKDDHRKEIDITNQGKQIEADATGFSVTLEKYASRLERLENRLDKMQEELNSQMVQNAILEVENKHLREKEREQGEEITRLRESDRKKSEKITWLEQQLKQAQTQIDILGRKIDELNQRKT